MDNYCNCYTSHGGLKLARKKGKNNAILEAYKIFLKSPIIIPLALNILVE